MKKTMIVVGAGKGLGNGVAEKFGSNDFRVVLMARSEEHLKEYVADFAAKGIEVYTQAADFSTFTQAFRKVVEAYGTPDVVFYNVGITAADEKDKITAQTLVERYCVDVAGAYNCIKLVDTKEFEEKEGAILVTGGGLALQPYADYLPLYGQGGSAGHGSGPDAGLEGERHLYRNSAGNRSHRFQRAFCAKDYRRRILETVLQAGDIGNRILIERLETRGKRAWQRRNWTTAK